MKLSSHTPVCGRKTAFSLIELLTVIAVVGILSAIVVAMVGGIRDKATLVNDLSKLKQIQSLVSLYAVDHNGDLPDVDGRISKSTLRWRWYGTEYSQGQETTHRSPLMDYANINDVHEFNKITIPTRNLSDAMAAGTETVNATEGAYGYPFVVNYLLMSNTIGTPSGNYNLIPNPSRTLLMTGSNPNTWGPGFYKNQGLNRIGGINDSTVPVVWADGHTSVVTLTDIKDNVNNWILLEQ
ncbi:type II secretion system protein [Ruficoccus amylovorans]|uniref:Type II secretion system protein n=1 Tax=Ruficoccus amylovorans TaxID=1804625 RepID=A0A842HIK1_9BACT|nr:type II secretion system protein [Ruficoccus amylovorans]MBC2595980.1 type II secretion system protein [Ruficoccus amylovorans]